MTPQQIASSTGSTLMRAAQWQPHLEAAAKRWGIDTPKRLAYWLAQIGVESGGLSLVEENLSYSAERLVAVWPNRFPTVAAAQPFARNPQALGDKVYGGRMGNAANEGFLYRGRGLKQLTGKDNYSHYAQASGRPVVASPDLLKDPACAADSAGWYWYAAGCNAYADKGDVVGLTRAINGGLNGLAERRALTTKALSAFSIV